jgi:FkbM family methyltransferase
MGIFRPSRRKLRFWWENRDRWKALDLLRSHPVLGEGVTIGIRSDGVFLEVRDGRRFFWEPRVKGSLLGIPFVGDFEPSETELLSSLVRPGDTVFDIGANFGWYTTLFSRLVGERGRVVAFEPVPPTFHELEQNLALNGHPGNVHAHLLALGERNGTVTLHVPTWPWLGPAFASAARQHGGPHETYTSPMETLNGFMGRTHEGCVDLVKCDVEGGELAILKGAGKILGSGTPPIWFLEVQEGSTRPFGYRPEDLFAFLREYRYEGYYTKDGHLLSIPPSGPLPEYNFLFIIPDLHRARVPAIPG